VFGTNLNENDAFFHFTEAIGKVESNIPKILYKSITNPQIYILNDLGKTDLLSFLIAERKINQEIPQSLAIYKKALNKLCKIQFEADKYINYNLCWQSNIFSKDDMNSDINYFINNFLSYFNINHQRTKAIFTELDSLTTLLNENPDNVFMYRDFQARNIIVTNEEPFFIDYQGGRKGAYLYDLASILNQAKAQLTNIEKSALKEHYFNNLQLYRSIQRNDFEIRYYGFSLLRVIQTLGAYGLRGLKEKKEHFIQSIPAALNNLLSLLNQNPTTLNFNTLNNIILDIEKIF